VKQRATSSQGAEPRVGSDSPASGAGRSGCAVSWTFLFLAIRSRCHNRCHTQRCHTDHIETGGDPATIGRSSRTARSREPPFLFQALATARYPAYDVVRRFPTEFRMAAVTSPLRTHIDHFAETTTPHHTTARRQSAVFLDHPQLLIQTSRLPGDTPSGFSVQRKPIKTKAPATRDIRDTHPLETGPSNDDRNCNAESTSQRLRLQETHHSTTAGQETSRETASQWRSKAHSTKGNTHTEQGSVCSWR
jgi:hypothetical protein